MQCSGRSRGGVSTKLHAVVDLDGRLLHIELTPEQRHEMIAADELREHARGKALVADAGYDSNRFQALPRLALVQLACARIGLEK
jgi:transposase